MPSLPNPLTLGDIGSWEAPVGSPPWVKRTHVEALAYLAQTESDAKHLEVNIQALRVDNRYQQLTDREGRPFLLWEMYCTTLPPFGLGYSPIALAALIQERKTAQAHATDPAPLADHGAVGRGRHRDSVRKSMGGGENAEYLTARIARDHKDVLAEMQRGEHPSVRAAAKRAGLVKDRWSVPAHNLGAMALYLRAKLTAAQRAELARLLRDELSDGDS